MDGDGEAAGVVLEAVGVTLGEGFGEVVGVADGVGEAEGVAVGVVSVVPLPLPPP